MFPLSFVGKLRGGNPAEIQEGDNHNDYLRAYLGSSLICVGYARPDVGRAHQDERVFLSYLAADPQRTAGGK